jgi:phosphoenolpyruvate carboxykinase (GTP)
MPHKSDLDLSGLDVSDADMQELLRVDREGWIHEAEDSAEFFKQFGDRLPKEMMEQNRALRERLKG